MRSPARTRHTRTIPPVMLGLRHGRHRYAPSEPVRPGNLPTPGSRSRRTTVFDESQARVPCHLPREGRRGNQFVPLRSRNQRRPRRFVQQNGEENRRINDQRSHPVQLYAYPAHRSRLSTRRRTGVGRSHAYNHVTGRARNGGVHLPGALITSVSGTWRPLVMFSKKNRPPLPPTMMSRSPSLSMSVTQTWMPPPVRVL